MRQAARGQREDFPVLIQDLGWDAYFDALWSKSEGCAAARVVVQQRALWRVTGEFGECWAHASGKLRMESEASGDWPAVGDWVAAEIQAEETEAIIQHVLPRRSRFARKSAGKEISEQVIAANVDVALIVAALDGDFNVRRIERYITQCWESGARPAIVLNKADACAEREQRIAAAERVALGVQVFVVSAKTGEGVEALEASFRRGQTVVFLGSSGAGKSTLVNRLLGEERQLTNDVRESDSRGHHTTTSRELFLLPNGAMVIDTPGLRELSLWNAAEGLAQAFADVEEIAARCKFRDCRHGNEPGCAVQTAIASGILDAKRLQSRSKLEREQEFLLRKLDPEARHAEKKRVKVIMRQVRDKYKSRDKGSR
ncbi:MAG: ribosome small subunit-dependent GTPase A [Candidatus Acidiferrum sp.]